MNRFFHLCALLFALVISVSAQETNKLKFQGFNGGFITFSPMDKGFRSFEFKADYDPFHLVIRGKANAGPQTANLDILTEDIGVVVSYFDVGYKDPKGNPQIVAINELLLFVSDEPGKVKDVVVELLPPGNNPAAKTALAGVPNLVKAYQVAVPSPGREAEEDGAITVSLADPWDKEIKEEQIKSAQIAVEKAKRDSVAAIQAKQKATQDSIQALAALRAKALQAKQDSVKNIAAAREKAKQDSIAAATEKPAKKKKKKKVDLDSEEGDTSADPGEVAPAPAKAPVLAKASDDGTPLKKKKKKKKKKIVENEDSSDGSEAVAESSDDRVPSDKEGFSGKTEQRRKIGMGLAIAGGVAVIYGLYEHSQFNSRLNQLKDMELKGTTAEQRYTDLGNEKKGFESRRTAALLLGGLCIAGSVVMFRF